MVVGPTNRQTRPQIHLSLHDAVDGRLDETRGDSAEKQLDRLLIEKLIP